MFFVGLPFFVHMVFLWFSYGFPMVFLWFSYGFPMVFTWFSYGLCKIGFAACAKDFRMCLDTQDVQGAHPRPGLRSTPSTALGCLRKPPEAQ